MTIARRINYEARRSVVRECLDLNLGFVEVVAVVGLSILAIATVAIKEAMSLGENDG
jgi:hypothetical protein